MIEYPKINSVFKRDAKGRFTDAFADPVFEYLYDLPWICTEKVDGMNIRIGWDGERVEFGGRTDNAQLPTHLFAYLSETFTPERMAEFQAHTVLFGEGYGMKIQSAGKGYLPDSVAFILFDVWVGGWWLRPDDVLLVAAQLRMDTVPVIGIVSLREAIEIVREGYESAVAKSHMAAEGLVCRPAVQMLFRDGKPIITKVKTRDFRRES